MWTHKTLDGGWQASRQKTWKQRAPKPVRVGACVVETLPALLPPSAQDLITKTVVIITLLWTFWGKPAPSKGFAAADRKLVCPSLE